jgi:hypothetical protein
MGEVDKAVRKTAVALTLSTGSNTDMRTAVQVRLPVRLGADATITDIHFRNYRDRTGVAFTGPLDFVGVCWGTHAQDASGVLTGNFTAAPRLLAGAASTPPDGSEHKINGLNIPIKAGVDYLLSYAYTCAEQTNCAGAGGGWTNETPSDVSERDATQHITGFSPLDVWLEITTTAPIIAHVGESHSAGVGNDLPVYQSPPALHGRANGYIPLMYVHSGSAMSSWLWPQTVKYTKWSGLDKPDAMVFALGKNDITETTTTDDLRAKFAAVYPTITAATSVNVYLTTVVPNLDDTDAIAATRRAWNEILLTEHLGNAVMVFDPAKALTISGGTGLDPAYAASDGIHLNKRGSSVYAASVTQPLHG